MLSTTEEPITIGLELEFMVDAISEVPCNDDRWPPALEPGAKLDYFDSKASVEICKSLAKNNLPASCYLLNKPKEDPIFTINEGILVRETKISDTEYRTNSIPCLLNAKDDDPLPDYRVWNTTADNSTNRLPLCFTTWNFESERSIKNRFGYPALEMTTPIISHPSQQKQLSEVVKILRDNFRITINENCGMHIHAGYQSDPPCASDLYTLRKVVAIVRLTEKPFILQLCHPDRRRKSEWVGPISNASAIADQVFGDVKNNTQTEKTYDENYGGKLIRSICQFRSKMKNRCYDEGLAFKFIEYLFTNGNMKKFEDEVKNVTFKLDTIEYERTSLSVSLNKPTLEFRYFESMFDTHMMDFWIKFVRQLFSISKQPDDEFKDKLEIIWEMATRKQGLSLKEWLDGLGLSEYENTCVLYLQKCRAMPLDGTRIFPKSDMEP